jgi:hypothetical protein
MKGIVMKTYALGLVSAIALLPVTVDAATILSIDLTVVNQVTITAGAGVASTSVSGSDFTGVYLDQFFGGAGSSLGYSLISGDLTTANNPTNSTPLLFRAGSSDPGLNIWAFSTDAIVSFTAGSLAFAGAATWALSAASYADMLAGSTGGSIFFAADSVDDVAGATSIGEWAVSTPIAPVPIPASALLFGSALAGLGIYGRRRTRKAPTAA